jgi:hypothetical protein
VTVSGQKWHMPLYHGVYQRRDLGRLLRSIEKPLFLNLTYGLDDRRDGVRFPAGVRDFPLHDTHSPSYTMGTGGGGAIYLSAPPFSAKVTNGGALPHSSDTWCLINQSINPRDDFS